MQPTKFQMNDVLKDKVSGFQGQVLAITFYSTGCTHYGLAPRALKQDGTLHDFGWFDETRLELVKAAETAMPEKATSGPDMNPRMY